MRFFFEIYDEAGASFRPIESSSDASYRTSTDYTGINWDVIRQPGTL